MQQILNLYKDIEKLKHTPRKGWVKRGVTEIVDTIASHSYGAIILGWILAQKENLDQDKVIKLLLIHDLVMAHITDYMPEQEEYNSKIQIENKAFDKLQIPQSTKPEFTALFEEYQEQKTEEARLARQCDKLDTLFQAFFYSKKLGKDIMQEFLQTYNGYFKSDTGKKYYQQLAENFKNKSI